MMSQDQSLCEASQERPWLEIDQQLRDSPGLVEPVGMPAQVVSVRRIPLDPVVYETRSYLLDDETTHAVAHSYYRILLELSTGRK
jgi:hypothetical protein